MKKFLRPLGLAAVFLLLAVGVYAASSEDGLVSLRYLQDTFIPKTVQAGEEAAGQALQKTYDSAKGQLDALAGNAPGGVGLFSESLERRIWTDGQIITLSTGGCFLPMDGSVDLTHTGVVVDVTLGAEVPSGGKLEANHRYLVGEDTQAALTVRSGQAALGLQGSYSLTGGRDPHTPFFDVSQRDWFYDPVNYAYQRKLFSGVDAGHFSPGSSMNRAMLMVVLHSLAGNPAPAAANSFTDVPNGSWFTNAVAWGVEQGIASGTGNGIFAPDGEITREQTVLMLYNYAARYLGKDMAPGTDLSGYGDYAGISAWSREAMSWAVGQGILSGVDRGGTRYADPQRGASRAEMATMLRAFCEKIL